MNARLKFSLITAVTLLAVLITLALGRWQLSRAAQKEALQSSAEASSALSRLSAQALVARTDLMQQLQRGVTLRGRWLTQHTVLLDNRQMNKRQGLIVVTPMQLEGSKVAVLVQRGWVPRNFMDRTLVPKIETPLGSVEIEGRIAAPPSKLYEFGAYEAGLIRQNLDMDRFASESGLHLLDVSVQQSGAAGDGLLREWPQAGNGVEKNYGYAFQWFALSALLVILYGWFQIVRRFIIPRRT